MKTILLADDSITIQKVVELTFSDGDYRVLCVSNGSQALRKIAEARPDVVLLDVIMPEKNGYEVCEAMKADPATAGIPVLLLTGTFEPFDRQRADAAGAEGHLTKPFESHTLVARVDELIARGAAPRAPAPAPASAPGEPRAAHPGFAAAPAAAPAMEAEPNAPAPPPFAPMPPTETTAPASPHPAFDPPGAAGGGSYMGFADLSMGDDAIVQDRYDSMEASATVRIPRAAPAPAPAADAGDTPGMEGFVPGYDMPDARPAPREPGEVAGRATPSSLPVSAADAPAAGAADAGGGTAAGLSDDALERLAEMIVRRMSDRVVREIAWEVIPGVAEALVRQRIREIENQDR